MFFKKKQTAEPKLIDVVTKTMDTGFVFWNISDDLGHSAKTIMESTPRVVMAYGYARRAAAAALYLQGLFNKDAYNHAESMFKALQQKTGHTVEFQEDAGADAMDFMQSYHYLINGLIVKKMIQIAREYDLPNHRMSDAELFERVTETYYAEQGQ